MKYLIFASCIILIISCEDNNFSVTSNNQVVVQAYLYSGNPVKDIRLTSTMNLNTDTIAADPINDAEVILIKNNQEYILQNSPGDSGYYQYLENDLQVNVKDQFYLRIIYNGEVITASTSVPEKPASIIIDNDIITIPDFGTFGNFNRDSAFTDVRWYNPSENLYFVTIKNIDVNPIEIENEFRALRIFVSSPTNRDFYRINAFTLSHTGLHRVNVYRINQEYADLYESRQQDSRDLNEPLSNINNGLGIFSAFSSDSVFFTVIQ